MQAWNESIENVEELQELLIRLVDAYQDKFGGKQISAKNKPVYNVAFVRKQAKEEGADDSDTNCSSIAFMLECGEHRIAMLGDAFADIIEETIDNKYKDQAKPITYIFHTRRKGGKVSRMGNAWKNSRKT